ncbi:MAG: hypothetical protein ACKPKO_34295, partial [Candidatus Fonsibacter sp.]
MARAGRPASSDGLSTSDGDYQHVEFGLVTAKGHPGVNDLNGWTACAKLQQKADHMENSLKEHGLWQLYIHETGRRSACDLKEDSVTGKPNAEQTDNSA